MTAFAVVFLLKVSSSSSSYSVSIHVDAAEIRRLIERLLVIIKGVAPQLHPKHLLITICSGIEQLLLKRKPPFNYSTPYQHQPDLTRGQPQSGTTTGAGTGTGAFQRPIPGPSVPSTAMSDGGGGGGCSADWAGFDTYDPFMSEFDFLSSQPPMDSFMFAAAMSTEDML